MSRKIQTNVATLITSDPLPSDPNVRQALVEAQAAGGGKWPGATLPDIGQLTAQASRIATDIATVSTRIQTAFDSSAVTDLRRSIRDFGQIADRLARVTNELDAIVGGTESATETILGGAEEIDQMVQTLMARLKDEQNQALASDIQDRVVKIFEACNFQDLTGQRITKVVGTLKFIETHIVRMMEIWGGLEAFKDIQAEKIAERKGDAALLNGPKLAGEVGHASQDDIDSLFA